MNSKISRSSPQKSCNPRSLRVWSYFGRGLTALLLVALLIPFTARTPAAAASAVSADNTWGRMPLYFIANQGQMDSRVAYYVPGSDKTLFFTPEGVTFALAFTSPRPPDERSEQDQVSGRWIVKLDFVDAADTRLVGQVRTDTIISYFKGSRDEWHAGLPTYSKIVYRDLWEGIDLAYSGTVNRLKYEFVVQPGADPARIRLAYRGATVRLAESGQLEVSTPAGGFQDDVPIAYQDVNGQRVSVMVTYALEGDGNYGFHLGVYDPALPLVIDPAVLVYCGYIGGSDYDIGESIAVDAAGNAYVIGTTYSTETTFPETVGPDLTSNGLEDAFVAKVKADGTGLVYAGYIGGSGEDYGYGIAVDTAGNVYVTGYTESTQATFPVTVGPDLTHNGLEDAFVAKVKADGTGLVYAGYIGGSGDDWSNDIAVDSADNVYVVGATESDQSTFPVTGGPDLIYNGGDSDAFIAKVKADGSGLVYAGYVGGDQNDKGNSIAVDATNNAYFLGVTESTQATFPETVGPDLTHNGYEDAFVAKVKADGTGLVYAGYIGGSDYDIGESVTVDTAGNTYITGWTWSDQATFPVTIGPDLNHNGGIDAFVAKVKADGTGLVYAGYIGGSDKDYGYGIAVDSAGNAYVVGSTKSTQATFPVTVGPDLTYNAWVDAFVAKVKADGRSLVYAGYIGGDDEDQGYAIAVDSAGNAYVTGSTASTATTFPVTVGPDLIFNGGSIDAFVAKVSSTVNVTLTFKSTGTYDGWILESGENTNIGGTLDRTSTTFNLGDGIADKQYRAILSFNTASLPDTAVIIKVTLKIRKQTQVGSNPFTILGGLKVDMRKPFFGTTLGLVISDFQAVAGKSAIATFGATPVAYWYSAVLNSIGKAYINKTGSTQFRLYFYKGDNDDMNADYMKFFSGNYAYAASRPTLVIEYYLP